MRRIPFQIDRRQTRISLVPDLRGQGVAAEKVLVFLFVLASIQHEPIGSRITDAVAEDGIETEAGLVDEIVHVAFDRAVVVAEEDHSLLAIEKDPAREMDRANAPEAAAPNEMPRRVIDGAKNADQPSRAAPDPASGFPWR